MLTGDDGTMAKLLPPPPPPPPGFSAEEPPPLVAGDPSACGGTFAALTAVALVPRWFKNRCKRGWVGGWMDGWVDCWVDE